MVENKFLSRVNVKTILLRMTSFLNRQPLEKVLLDFDRSTQTEPIRNLSGTKRRVTNDEKLPGLA